jgi:uncharacterized protein YcbX
MSPSQIGRIAEIWRYPVKSMRGEALEQAQLRWTGIAGDRQFAFVRTNDRSRFPYLTGRVAPEMVLFQAATGPGPDPRNAPISVTAPTGEAFDAWDEELASRLTALAGEPVHPMRLGRGCFDQHPVSVIMASTLRRLEERAGRTLDRRRFRNNIVIADWSGISPEHDWIGRTLRFGDDPEGPALRIDEPDSRCVMITIDPDTAERDPAVMRVVAQDFDNCVGLYCAPSALGTIAVGDPVYAE